MEATGTMTRQMDTWVHQNMKSKHQDSKFNGNGTIKPSAEEFEHMELKLDQFVSFKPPLAYTSTRFRLAEKIELPRALTISSFGTINWLSPKRTQISTRHGPSQLKQPRIPWFLAIPRSDSSWRMNWKVLVLMVWNESTSRAMSPLIW